MSNVFLGIIAVSVLVMAILQVAAALLAAKAFKRVAETVERLGNDVQPIIRNVHQVTTDATRVSSLAVAQVERLDVMVGKMSVGVERTATAVPQLLENMRDSFSIVGAIKAIVAAYQDLRRSKNAKYKPDGALDDEDPMFVG